MPTIAVHDRRERTTVVLRTLGPSGGHSAPSRGRCENNIFGQIFPFPESGSRERPRLGEPQIFARRLRERQSTPGRRDGGPAGRAAKIGRGGFRWISAFPGRLGLTTQLHKVARSPRSVMAARVNVRETTLPVAGFEDRRTTMTAAPRRCIGEPEFTRYLDAVRPADVHSGRSHPSYFISRPHRPGRCGGRHG